MNSFCPNRIYCVTVKINPEKKQKDLEDEVNPPTFALRSKSG
jgi:hypothetical protein